ncbi:glycosyl transferase [Phaeovulum sp.]|uniref:glycosyl transferase n=1 Tax=Phaeovulum sp. TaxID=2934796 RepID=UPI0039E21D7F
MQVLYIAHNLDDPAIWRRVAMLRRGGAVVTVAGFRRGEGPLPGAARVLGRTRNARMSQRVIAVLRARQGATLPDGRGFDAIIARNLETLALAVVIADRAGRRGGQAPRLVYEVLDIHRLMLRGDMIGRTLRALERRWCRAVDLVLVSSPAFVTQYFDTYRQTRAPVLLVENKVMAGPDEAGAQGRRLLLARGGPLVIGWFGILRCAFSLACLDAVTRAAPGRYKVMLRGQPAYDVLPDFDAVVAANPDLHFAGPYAYPDDLARIYGEVDLAWLVDRYEKGANSDWLLPNRLYESGLNVVPPICLAGTEVARMAERLEIGLRLKEATVAAASLMLAQVDGARLAALRQAQADVAPAVWRTDPEECRDLVAALGADMPGRGLRLLRAGGLTT